MEQLFAFLNNFCLTSPVWYTFSCNKMRFINKKQFYDEETSNLTELDMEKYYKVVENKIGDIVSGEVCIHYIVFIIYSFLLQL